MSNRLPRTARAPKYARCDYCGRNAHKVAVQTTRGVQGYCPSCYTGFEQRGHAAAPENVLYDRRAKKSA